MRRFIISIILSFLPCIFFAQDHEARMKFYDVSDYNFRIQLNDTTNEIRCEANINVHVSQKTDTLCLDLAGLRADGKGMIIDRIRCESGNLSFLHSSDKIILPLKGILIGEDIRLQIDYHGIPADGLIIGKNKFGNRTFFGDNWPDRAHQWLPCVDHPSDKAKVEFAVTAPSHYKVVAVGSFLGEKPGIDFTTTTWKMSFPISTKLMVIGVAEFAVQDLATISGIPVSTWVYPENKAEGFIDYAAAVKPLVYFTKLLSPYPFSKLANVQSTTLYGGMENASCIFYAENSVTGSGKAERLMAHEIAHQWFGDALSEKDWYHIWLSEGFSTYLTGMYIENTYGRGSFIQYMNLGKQEVFAFEKIHPGPVVDSTLHISDELLNPNTYEKASWVLHMLRKELGDSLFTGCLRTFYNDYRYGNAVTSDLQSVAEKISGRSLETFFSQWLFGTGHPVLDIIWSFSGDSLNIRVKQVQPGQLFSFPLEFKIINKNTAAGQVEVMISTKDQNFNISHAGYPVRLMPDPDNWLLMESTVKQNKAKE